MSEWMRRGELKLLNRVAETLKIQLAKKSIEINSWSKHWTFSKKLKKNRSIKGLLGPFCSKFLFNFLTLFWKIFLYEFSQFISFFMFLHYSLHAWLCNRMMSYLFNPVHLPPIHMEPSAYECVGWWGNLHVNGANKQFSWLDGNNMCLIGHICVLGWASNEPMGTWATMPERKWENLNHKLIDWLIDFPSSHYVWLDWIRP